MKEPRKSGGLRLGLTIRRYFPDRELILRTEGRVVYLKISRGLQFSVILAALLATGWGIFSSFSFFVSERIIADKDKQILAARLVYRNLLADVSDYQNRFAAITVELQKNHTVMLNLVDTNATLQQNLKTVESRLESSHVQKQRILAATDTLRGKLGRIETDMSALNNRNFELRSNLDSVSSSLEDALAARNEARAKNRRLTEEVGDLKRELVELHDSEFELVDRLNSRAVEDITAAEEILKRTGIKMSRLTAGLSTGAQGQGGPFTALDSIAEPGDKLKFKLTTLEANLQRWDELRDMLTGMPLPPPMDSFSISSHYGKRRDPINKKWAMHFGIDLAGIPRTSIYSSAPGVVTAAGNKGKYGRFVEIEHANGFVTRYGHLHKILVKRGQKVEYREKVGLLGSSGRSTGTHLHYEILHKGRHVNPWSMMKAGRYVYQR